MLSYCLKCRRNIESNSPKYVKTKKQKIFFLPGFSFTDTGDSQGSREREGTILIPICHFHPLKNIQTFTCILR